MVREDLLVRALLNNDEMNGGGVGLLVNLIRIWVMGGRVLGEHMMLGWKGKGKVRGDRGMGLLANSVGVVEANLGDDWEALLVV